MWVTKSFVVVLLACALPSLGAEFTGLGDLSGGPFNSQGRAVSRDGTTLVGLSASAASNPPNHSDYEAYRWTAGGGMLPLGALPGPVYDSYAYGVSGDGSVIVGGSLTGGDQAFRWTAAGGMVGLNYLPGGNISVAMATSADGSVVVGFGNTTGASYEGFRWTSSGGMVGLGQLPGDVSNTRSTARAVSADGLVIAGEGYTTDYQAIRWTKASGLVSLGSLPGGGVYSSGQGISSDGNTIVGFADSPQGIQAFRWTSASGMVGLGDLPGGAFTSHAQAVSADGSIVVGYGTTDSGDTAFIWDSVNGIRDLKSVLEVDLGLDLTGWTLQLAMGISDDGSVITGTGTNPDGQTEAWIAVVPEPGTASLLIIAGVMRLNQRNRLLI